MSRVADGVECGGVHEDKERKIDAEGGPDYMRLVRELMLLGKFEFKFLSLVVIYRDMVLS